MLAPYTVLCSHSAATCPSSPAPCVYALLCPPSLLAGFGGDLTSKGILDFVDSGKHLILTGSSEASDMIRSLALECGVEFDDKGTAVYDHFSHQAAGGAADATVIATSQVVDSKAIFGSTSPKVGPTSAAA